MCDNVDKLGSFRDTSKEDKSSRKQDLWEKLKELSLNRKRLKEDTVQPPNMLKDILAEDQLLSEDTRWQVLGLISNQRKICAPDEEMLALESTSKDSHELYQVLLKML